MTIPVHMPALSPTMEEGGLAKWHVKEGDTVSPGDIIAEIETDKATMEIEAVDEGVVGRLLVEEGASGVPVGTLIALLLEEGEDKSALDNVASGPPPGKVNPPAPEKASPAPPEPAPASAAPVPIPSVSADLQTGTRIKASPLARRLAREQGIDLATLQGSGPHGRIIRRDLGAAPATAAPSVAAAAPAPAVAPVIGDAPYREEKLSAMRKIIARRLMESKQTIPHFYLSVDARIDKLLKARADINAELTDARISVNDFIVMASALALQKVPAANVQYAGDVMRYFSRADISVAVATDKGLITPVIRDAANKGLKEISNEVKALAEKARAGKLMPEDYQGGSFSISNLGMYGIREFSAVINPPQAAILAVGAGEERAVVCAGAVDKATVMTMTLSLDHRAIDGAVGAEFLNALKGYLEEPLSMLL